MDTEPRSAKGRRTRARLIDAGKRVFERDGFLQARISDIAAEAEVSHGSFYHYFESKESLFREIAAEVEVRLVSMDDTGADGERPTGPIDRIRAANRSYLTAYRDEAAIMRVIEEVSRYDEDVRRVRTERDDQLAARLEATIARLQAEGLADQRIDTRYAAQALGGMVARFAETLFFGAGSFDLETAVEQLTLLWANALGLKENRARKARGAAGAA
ncbi:TetR/AcrR family transcriptional regulator [Trujillonella endophytica]|uniref:Transcriptional regulator, TetR family n=1 Tax=Trujillonella endophytica TaxID=673521 RepID=A0A1H8Q613_9ACTN|nr:TetR/AcrR family transcriptional regulator [Trujillella endophytica]SEO49357.1 transcriptional regulator, TetR family [Trujillella endophytica]